jgi:hypothetical protein
VILQDHLPIQYHQFQMKDSKFIYANIFFLYNFRSLSFSQYPLITPSSNVNDRSASSNNNSETYAANGDDSNNKCPICFMIFPLNMTYHDRQKHVGEHMIDDQDTNNIIL